MGTESRPADIDTVNGTGYAHGFMISATSYPTWADVNLSRSPGHLKGIVGLGDTGSADSAYVVTLRADGRVIFNQTVRLGNAFPVDVDTQGALRLRLEISPLPSPDGFKGLFDWICLCNAQIATN